MNTKISFLCAQYQYPPAIGEYLHKCCEIFLTIDPSSIFLIGSASRGEMSLLKTDNILDMISDLEYLIFIKEKLSKETRKLLNSRIELLEKYIPHENPHFHIDYALIPFRRASRISRNLAIFEMKALGKNLAGYEDDILRLPFVNDQNIDRFALNQLVLVRLWWLLAGIPKRCINGKPTKYEIFMFRYVACRNLLDVPTILLPNEGHLIAGYKPRACFLKSNYRSLNAVKYFGLKFSEDVAQELKNKINLKFIDLPIPAYKKTVNYYVSLVRYLLKMSPETTIKVIYDELVSTRTVFDANTFSRQRIRMAILPNGKNISFSTINHLHCICVPVESIIIAILLAMHMALNELFEGRRNNCKEWLGKALRMLTRIDPYVKIVLTENEENNWIMLRFVIGEMICKKYGFLARRNKYINNMLKWSDEGSDDNE